MSDHFAPQIVLLVGAMAFILVFMGSFGVSMTDSELEKIELSGTTEFEDTWLDTGGNWESLENNMPSELYLTVIVTVIILGLYIAFKTISGALPNWLSGG